jgi:hypothetical protein
MTHPENLISAAPDADVAEQAAHADPQWDSPSVSDDLEAPEWDAREQSEVVHLEDDYR